MEQKLPEVGNGESRLVIPREPSDAGIELGPVPDNLRNFVSQGKVGTVTAGSDSCSRPVVILRDTGASQSLMFCLCQEIVL